MTARYVVKRYRSERRWRIWDNNKECWNSNRVYKTLHAANNSADKMNGAIALAAHKYRMAKDG